MGYPSGLKLVLTLVVACGFAGGAEPDLWRLARKNRAVHRFSTLITAQNIRDLLSSEAEIDSAIDWCKRTAVTRVYIESFRDGYQAERVALLRAKKRFLAAGFEVSGCITPTRVGKPTGGYRPLSCYTDQPTQDKIQQSFEYAASMFDEIMIDDFWFTDCTCSECNAARLAWTAIVGRTPYPVPGETWEDFRRTLMVNVSRDRILAPARRVNPKVRVIIKYPQWYDYFHDRGYDVAQQTEDFDRIWVGTETRDVDKGGVPPYEAYFIMRWLRRMGGPKTGGGWYDPYDTTPLTYIEQARQTILGGARESLLFCYGSLLVKTGPENIDALRTAIPELFSVAAEVGRREPAGVAAYKPPNSHPENERYVYDYVGMLGVPLVPCHKFPADAPAAFFPAHALKDPDLASHLSKFIASGRPALITDGLAERLGGQVDLSAPNVRILRVKRNPKSLLGLSQEELDGIRARVLAPLRAWLRAPAQVGVYLFKDGSWVLENFNHQGVTVQLNQQPVVVPARGWVSRWTR